MRRIYTIFIAVLCTLFVGVGIVDAKSSKSKASAKAASKDGVTQVGPDVLACDPCFPGGEPVVDEAKGEVFRKVSGSPLITLLDKNGVQRRVEVRGNHYLVFRKETDPTDPKRKRLVAIRTEGGCEIVPGPPPKPKLPPPPPPQPKIVERIVKETVEVPVRVNVPVPVKLCGPFLVIPGKDGAPDLGAVCADWVSNVDRVALLFGTYRGKVFGAYDLIEPWAYTERLRKPPCNPDEDSCDVFQGLPIGTSDPRIPPNYRLIPEWYMEQLRGRGMILMTYAHLARVSQELSYAQYGNDNFFGMMGDISFIYHYAADTGYCLAFEVTSEGRIKARGNVSLDNPYPNIDFVEGLGRIRPAN